MANSDYVTVKVSGLEDVQKKLEELPFKVAKKNMRAGLKVGAEVIRKAWAQAFPRATGFESDHIDIRTRLRGNDLAGTAFIGPNNKLVRPERIGKVAPNGKPWRQWTAMLVARFWELGTTRMPKKPVGTQAFETHKQAAVDAIAEFLKEKLGL